MNDRRPLIEDTAPAVSAALPEFTPSQWGRLGAGAALVLAGSGALSVAAIARLALVAGGGVLAYTAWREASRAAADGRDTPAEPSVSAPSIRDTLRPSKDRLPTLRDALATDGASNADAASSDGRMPALDLRDA